MPTSCARTDIGRRRKSNQDYLYTSDEQIGRLPNLYVVADGMGGHNAGDFASRFTVDQMKELIRKSEQESIPSVFDEALHIINLKLRRIAAQDERYYGMGTTLVGATVVDDTLYVANIGDSRLYVLKDSLTQITIDHSLVEEMVLSGTLDQKKARTHPDRNIITRAIGAEDWLEVDYFSEKIEQGELVLMCSDGLTNMLEDSEIESVLRDGSTLSEKCDRLVDWANERGGRDNISVVIIRL
ncbi:MAG: Stp1/IreP family PP2C-type Ser/Thr phosphatase [Lachnospiraceae bacterium]|nr:Stp1/IreP family PP2C-type Ser/Thr phosphatase [Lachnospiraceae bacterium]